MAKVYAVKQGRKTGIFKTWSECEAQTKGFSGAIFKSFASEQEALVYLSNTPDKPILNGSELHVYVDGSCTKNGERYSGAFVVVQDGQIVFEWADEGTDKNAMTMRNVAGEILAATKAVDYMLNRKTEHSIIIFYDYMGLANWPDGAWKTNNEFTARYAKHINNARKQIDIHFQHVRAHTGNIFNERADTLAKEALNII
ncbi:Ribonuclease H [compost metagenome]